MRRSCLVVGSLVGIGPFIAALAPSEARAQSLRWTRDGSVRHEEFGASLAWLPDRDGDGVDEIVAGAPGSDRVRVLSGRDLSLLLELEGPAGSAFGAAVAVVADLDGDGGDDLAIGAPGSEEEDRDGVVQLRSSRDGALLRELRGGVATPGFGRALARLDDVDGDGVGELAIGMAAPRGVELPPDAGSGGAFAIVSTAQDRLLALRVGAPDDLHHGERCESLRDLDGDGRRDLATIAWLPDDSRLPRDATLPALELLSGATLEPIRVVDLTGMGPRVSPELLHCAALGDCDGDGRDDVAIADAGPLPDGWYDPFKGVAWIVSGRTGELLREWRKSTGLMGEGIGSAGDIDGDGRCDVAITQHYGPGVAPDLQRFIAVLSVRTGHELRRINPRHEFGPPAHSRYASVILGERDLDGDDVPDLVAGSPESNFVDSTTRGRVMTLAIATEELLALRWGGDVAWPLAGPCARIGDVDGDGVADIAASERWVARDPGSVALLSGRDGSLLRRIAPDEEDFEFGAALAPLPDFDGDGVLDLAIGATQRIEVRSGRDGSLLRAVTTGLDPGAVRALAAGVQPDGHVHVLAGQPWFDTLARRIENGKVVIWDLTADRGVHQRRGSDDDEQLGSAVAFLGDVTNDGVGDWAAGAPRYSGVADRAGRVAVLNGATGAIQKQLFGAAVVEQFGAALVAAGDATGDGFGDLIVGAPGAGSWGHGRVTLFASRSWSVAWSIDGAKAAGIGALLQPIGDPNRDGHADFATRSHSEADLPQVELRSGASGRLLATLDGRDGTIGDDVSFGVVIGAESPWLDASARDATLLIGAPWRPERGPYSPPVGRIEAFDLPPLFLEVAPRHAAQGDTVRGDVRGAPPAAFVGILVAEIDGVPFEQFISLGVTDPLGDYRDWSLVPPGLSGTNWLLRAYSDGFDGHTAESSDTVLTFE